MLALCTQITGWNDHHFGDDSVPKKVYTVDCAWRFYDSFHIWKFLVQYGS